MPGIINFSLTFGQPPSDRHENAHDGRGFLAQTTRFLIQGTVEDHRGSSAFTLKISGADSRFETGGFVTVHHGKMSQWWKGAGRRSQPEKSFPGLHDALRLPFSEISQLAARHAYRGRQAGKERFDRLEERRRFIGAGAESYRIDLDFDPNSGLMAQTIISLPGSSLPAVSIGFQDYQLVEGVPVPHRITRRMAERVLIVESIASTRSFQSPTFRPGRSRRCANEWCCAHCSFCSRLGHGRVVPSEARS